MERLKSLKFVLLILMIIATLVIVKMSGKDRFTGDAQMAVETVASGANSVSVKDYNQNKSEYFLIELFEKEIPPTLKFENATAVVIDKLLEKLTLPSFKGRKVLLVSGNPALAAKAWVILNQFNIKDVYVLNLEENPEVLNYEFQPDTVFILEPNLSLN